MDFYFTDEGDLEISPSGDIAMTQTSWRDDLQQAYIRVLTDQGDFLMYPELGASLSELVGMPQSPETGAYGERLIRAALDREGRFVGKAVHVKAVPTGPQTLRFDLFIASGSQEQIQLSIEQELNI